MSKEVKEVIERAMEEVEVKTQEVKTQIKEIIRKGKYHPYVSKHYYQTNSQLFPRVPDNLRPYYDFLVQSINRQTSKTNTQIPLNPESKPFYPKSKTKQRSPLSLNSPAWYRKNQSPKNQSLNINAQEYIPKKYRRKDKVTSLTVYKPNVIYVKEQTGTSISNNIYDPTGLMYNLVNIIWQTLHKDILTSEPHLKASMGLNVGKLTSIKLENANRHHSAEQIVPIAIMSGKYETGTSKVCFQICIDPTSRSFDLFFLIASLTDKNIPTLSWKVSRIMYDREKSFTSLSDTILKLPATSNVNKDYANTRNVMNVSKNLLTHKNKKRRSKDGFQLYVSPIIRFFNSLSRNIKNIHSVSIGYKRTKKTILQLSDNDKNKIETKIDEKQFKEEASNNEISQTNTSGNYEQTIKCALDKSNENDIATKDTASKTSDNVNKADNKEETKENANNINNIEGINNGSNSNADNKLKIEAIKVEKQQEEGKKENSVEEKKNNINNGINKENNQNMQFSTNNISSEGKNNNENEIEINKNENNNEINDNLNVNEIINKEKSKQKEQMDDNNSKEKENNIEIKKGEKNPVEKKEEIIENEGIKNSLDNNIDNREIDDEEKNIEIEVNKQNLEEKPKKKENKVEEGIMNKSKSQKSSMITTTTTEAKTKVKTKENSQAIKTTNSVIKGGKIVGEQAKKGKAHKEEEIPYSEGNNTKTGPDCLIF